MFDSDGSKSSSPASSQVSSRVRSPSESNEHKRKQAEIEIDLDQPEPLSKKQKRLLKKGKIDENKKDPQKPHDTSQRSKFGVWIGNLSFDTTTNDLKRFMILKTQENEPEARLTEQNITRIHLPMNGRKCKGFAYIDFETPEQAQACIALSETNLNGRNILIKDHFSFEGRPPKQSNGVKNPPSTILFVGNLSHDTTEEHLEMHFQHCGEIVKIRMATFQDSGKCKGFAFIDFRAIGSATKALADKRCRKLDGRILRMEYGEDRSKRTKQQKGHIGSNEVVDGEVEKNNTQGRDSYQSEQSNDMPYENRRPPREDRPKRKLNNERQAKSPGLALVNAQRASFGIVPSTGKKITFD